ncbi:unnamed protein product, partial [Didymodactylos carnosus]
MIDIWKGSLRLGLITSPLSTTDELPLTSIPTWVKKEGFYIISLNTFVNLKSGCRISVWLTDSNQLHYAVNNVVRGTLLDSLPQNTPLWLFFDIYANTTAVQLINDDAPWEIKARGTDAIKHYQSACDNGTVPVYRTLLMIVGQKNCGKTRLKKMLLNEGRDKCLQESIDLSSSCSINIDESRTWTIIGLNSEHEPNQTNPIVKDVDDIQEYDSSLIYNIVLNLVKCRCAHTTDKKDKSWKDGLIEDFKATYSTFNVPDTIRTLIIQHIRQMKYSDAQSALTFLMESSKAKTINSVVRRQLHIDMWDFPGATFCYSTHQIFLSSRAVYLLVFDLTKDFDSLADSGYEYQSQKNKDLTNLDYLNFWAHSIYCHSANNSITLKSGEQRLSPPIIIVGTHRNSLSEDKNRLINEKFIKLQAMISKKPYAAHVIEPYFAVETVNTDLTDIETIDKLKKVIEQVCFDEPYMGEQQPENWVRFETALNNLKRQGNFYASLDQVCEIAREENICSSEELKTLLDFYHDVGIIVYFGNTQDMFLKNTLILRPQKLIEVIRRVIYDESNSTMDAMVITSATTSKLSTEDGILDERLFDILCQPYFNQKNCLLGLMKKFDLLCDRSLPIQGVTSRTFKEYIVPGRVRNIYNEQQQLTDKEEQSVIFYYDFHGFFPESLFHRILVRTIRWTQSQNTSQTPKLHYKRGRFFLDDDHDLILTSAPIRYARMKVQIIRIQTYHTSLYPEPTMVAKVRKFFETLLINFRDSWIKRLSSSCVVLCPCGKICDFHKAPYCTNDFCLHFLNLDECLSNSIVNCGFRRISTACFKQWFPNVTCTVSHSPVIEKLHELRNSFYDEATLPLWLRSASKLLNVTSDENDWSSLAKKLGYQKTIIDHFNSDGNPSLQLMTDWIVRSGNTTLGLDMLLALLKQIKRDDVIETINEGRESQHTLPPVFISYNWDIQDEVKELRNFLEKCGFSCWMDIGQMGGGELLYEKIDHGIRNAKVIICCVTPKYIVSTLCQRELILADLLKTPIIPVMFEDTPWPPFGSLSIVLSQLVYVDLKGVGGHGGSGKKADLQ